MWRELWEDLRWGPVVGFGKSGVIRSRDEPSDLRAQLIENMAPSAPVGGAKELSFLVVHFEICGKDELPGEDPGPACPYIVTHGWEGLGSGKWPCWAVLDLQRQRRKTSAKASFLWTRRHWQRWCLCTAKHYALLFAQSYAFGENISYHKEWWNGTFTALPQPVLFLLWGHSPFTIHHSPFLSLHPLPSVRWCVAI